jgi:hypothetical protein
MRIDKWVVGLLLLGLPMLGFAAVVVDSVTTIPEPETLGLIGGAVVAWAVVRWRKRK